MGMDGCDGRSDMAGNDVDVGESDVFDVENSEDGEIRCSRRVTESCTSLADRVDQSRVNHVHRSPRGGTTRNTRLNVLVQQH